MRFQSVLIELCLIWFISCYSRSICLISFEHRQSLLSYISRIDFLILVFVRILLLMRYDLKSSRRYLIFMFSAVLLMFIFLRNIAKSMSMTKSIIVLFIYTSSDMTNSILYMKSETHRITILFTKGMLYSTRSCIIRMKTISINRLF